MSIRKRILVILAAVMAITMLVAGLSFTAFADEDGNAFKVEQADGTITTYPAGTAFESVVSSAPANSTITLLDDASINTAFNALESITVDLNGFTVNVGARITPKNTAHVVFKNGTVNVTKAELVYMDEWSSKNATFEFNSVTVKKDANAENKTLVDMRVGTVILDGVTINEGEWNADFSSPNALISMGYRTREKSQTLKLEVKNSNITLYGIPLINGSGASDETLGYTLDVDVTDSYISTTTAVFRALPSAAASGANSYIDIYVSGSSELQGSTPITVNANIPSENVTITLDYGVISKKPTVGTVILGNDGNGVLDLLNPTDSSNTGVVRDLWADEHTPFTDYAYTFVAVGDTQNTVNYDAKNLHYIYDWILENKDTQNIKFVFGMGDITNHSLDSEWPIAIEQISRLNGVVPYSLVRGNHDTPETFNANLNNEAYRSMFDGFYSEDSAENAYVTFTVGETDFLHVTLNYCASNAELNWAAGIIQQHPMHKVIISTHSYINSDSTLSTSGTNTNGSANSGEQMWNKLVSQYPNIFLVLSGHVFSTDLCQTQMTGVHGNTVTTIMTNGQCHDFKNGAMGLISLLHFSEDGKSLSVEYYSTVYDRYFGDNSQFTLEIPEFDLSAVEPPTYLYEIIDQNGHKLSYADTFSFSSVLSNAAAGSTLKLLGNVDVDSAITAPADVIIDLNGYTLSTKGGRIRGNCAITVTNGTVKIINYELIYIDEGYTKAHITFANVDIINTSTNKVTAEVRDGSLTFDNVRISAANWGSSNQIMTLGSRTKSVGCAVPVVIKNSTIDLGTKAVPIVYYGGNSGEVNGYTATVTIINSTLSTAGNIVKTSPTADGAKNSSASITFDSATTIKSPTPFAFNQLPTDKVSISFAEGAHLSAIPSVSGVSINYGGDVFSYNVSTALFAVVKTENIDPTVYGCKLVDADGSVLCYWEGSVLDQTLVNHAQNAACSIVLVGNMTTPAGPSSSAIVNITVKALTIDLNNCTLTMSEWSRFLSSAASSGTTKFVLKNGTVKHPYNVYHSYSGSDDTSFTAEDVKFIATSTYTSFDHRIGRMTFTDCEFEFTSTATSLINVFTLGNTTRTNPVLVEMRGCKFTSTGKQRNVFKLYNGQPTDITLKDCEITLGSSAVLLLTENYQKTNLGDKLTVSECTINTANTKLYTIIHDTVTVTLDEVYVPTGATYETANGTVTIAKGQTMATVKEGGYMITAPKVSIQSNLTLYIDFTMNIWLPTDTNVTSINVLGVDYPLSDACVVGDKYRISVDSIGAGSAADVMQIFITYTDGEKTLTVEKIYSVIEYAKSIIESEKYSAESKSLLAYIVSYINSVYVYDEKAIPTELSALLSSDAYGNALSLTTSDGVTSLPTTSTDIGTAINAVKGARLSLGSSVQLIFALNPNYSGHLTLSYKGGSYECDVVNGTVGTKDYVTVNMRAFALYDEVITITAGEYSGTYDLAAYINGIMTEYEATDSLSALLLNLYNYCKEAKEYKEHVNANGGELN